MVQRNICKRVLVFTSVSLLSTRPDQCTAFSEQHSKTRLLNSVSYTKTGIFDGAELQALNSYISNNEDRNNSNTQQSPKDAKFGTLTFSAGKALIDGADRRVVGVESSGGGDILLSSMAFIPKGVSDADAVSTAIGALVGVHCCVPKVNKIGGSAQADGSDFVSGKAVILGGGAYARFCANALGTLGADVTIVTTGRPRIKNKKVDVLPPMVGELKVGFASALGQFDTLLDTLFDENKLGSRMSQMGSCVVVEELKRLHKCNRYVSTYSNAQKMITEGGLMLGPNKAKEYMQDIKSSLSEGRASNCIDVQIPEDFGQSTLQILLNNGVTFPASRTGDEPIIRGWTIEDFWEYASWPRDTTGSASSRFGLPVIDDIETRLEEEEDVNEVKQVSMSTTDAKNPFITYIQGVEGLHTHIISSELDCVLFLSAPYCRTCKNMSPQYTRMARLAKENPEGAITFAKADAMGKIGKDLGKFVGVDAVPAFLLFRGGKRYGSPLSISKLPSKKLDLALNYLTSGMEWDVATFRDA